jgi:ankyrin repeat protein
MVGRAFLAFGLLGNGAYGSSDASSDGTSDIPSQESKWEDLREAIKFAGDLSGCIDIAKKLREGIDYTLKSKNGKTVLFYVNCPEALVLLLSLPGIDVNAIDRKGNSALHLCAQCFSECLLDTIGAFSEEIGLLLLFGANPLCENLQEQTPRQIVEQWRTEEESLPKEDRTPNSAIALKKCREMIQKLIEAEAAWRDAHQHDA